MPPAGYSARRPTRTDAEAVAALMTAADEGADQVNPADIEREWRGLDIQHDAWLLEADADANAEAAAYADLLKRSEDHVASQGYVAPDHTGRGLGAALLELLEQRARELTPKGRLTNGVIAANRAAVALLEQRGYHPIRHFYRMVIELNEPPPEPQWPASLEPRPFDREQAEAFHDATEDAFAEEWRHEREPFDHWRRRRLDDPAASPDLWLAVHDQDEIAATLICDARRYEMGWIGSLGVRKPWRRRGLGRALLHYAFTEFWRRGERTVGLGVDAENLTGATRLYERAGMHQVFDAVVYEKRLSL
jgi:GNAT superfamily N-acetyltransferase